MTHVSTHLKDLIHIFSAGQYSKVRSTITVCVSVSSERICPLWRGQQSALCHIFMALYDRGCISVRHVWAKTSLCCIRNVPRCLEAAFLAVKANRVRSKRHTGSKEACGRDATASPGSTQPDFASLSDISGSPPCTLFCLWPKQCHNSYTC